MNPPILLHQWEISPFCGKVRKALRAKGLDFSVRNYHGLLSRKVGSVSPTKKLPVLDYGDERVHDSTAILRLLEERHPQPRLYPEAPTEAALAEILEDWADESLYWFEVYLRFGYPENLERAVSLLCEGRPAYEKVPFRLAARRSLRKKMQAQGVGRLERSAVEAAFASHLERIETLLGRGDWLVGAHRSIADIAVSAQLDEIVRTSHLADEVRARPRTRDWLERNA